MSDYRNYWERNIEHWGEYYLEISHGHEQYYAPEWLAALYKGTIAKIEARLMRDRFIRTLQFINKYVKPGVQFADIGCGTGIFTVEALKRGAKAKAIDFSQRALEVTKANVKKYVPEADVSYHLLDVQAGDLPRSDVAIMMGVSPYLTNLQASLENVFRSTNLLLLQYSERTHWANRIRRIFPILNVRRLIFQSTQEVDALYTRNGWKLLSRSPFATGYIDVAASQSIAEAE
jgi:precorrin-6B methylase 2